MAAMVGLRSGSGARRISYTPTDLSDTSPATPRLSVQTVVVVVIRPEQYTEEFNHAHGESEILVSGFLPFYFYSRVRQLPLRGRSVVDRLRRPQRDDGAAVGGH